MAVNRLDTPAGRFYDVDGEAFPSVTHVLGVVGKPALIHWAANQERDLVTEASADLYLDLIKTQPMSRPVYVATLNGRLGTVRAHRRALERAGAIGSQVHALIEWTLRKQLGQLVGPRPEATEPAWWAFTAFQTWADQVALKPRLIEQIVWSRTHRYAGTMDLLADVNGIPTLVDFKTGKAIYPEAHVQNVAYQVALAEMGHEAPAAGLIVRLPKVTSDPDFELATVPPVADLFPVFLAVRRVWQWAHDAEQSRLAAPPRVSKPATPVGSVAPVGESAAPVAAVAAAGTALAKVPRSTEQEVLVPVPPFNLVPITPSLHGAAVDADPAGEFTLTEPVPGSGAKVIDAELFSAWWSVYPRKTHKHEAERAFLKLSPNRGLVDRMIAAVEVQKQTAQWRSGVQYIPHPATWLNGERWNDEIEPKPVKASPAAQAAHQRAIGPRAVAESWRDRCPHTPPCGTPTYCELLRIREGIA